MAKESLEQKVESLEHRLDKVEHQVSLWEGLASTRIISLQEALKLIGWFILIGSLVEVLFEWLHGAPISWGIIISLLIGAWLAFRESSFFEASDSTRELLQEEQLGRGTSAQSLHKGSTIGIWEGGSTFTATALSGVVFGTLIVTGLVMWLIITFVPTVVGQLFVTLALLTVLLAYSITAGWKLLSLASTALIFLLLALGSNPVVSLLLLFAVAGWLTLVAWKRQDWSLLLLVVIAAHLSLFRWVGYQITPATSELFKQAIIGELELIAAVGFSLPLILSRRKAASRQMARSVIIVNTIGFTLVLSWLTQILIPNNWSEYLIVITLVGVAFATLAWQQHGRASHAKYFLLTSLLAALACLSLFLDSTLITLIWLMTAVVLLGAGFTAQSYTFRLTGLGVLVATVVRYLAITLPDPGTAAPTLFLHDRVWIGLLLVATLSISGLWFRESKAKGAEERSRAYVISGLYALSVLVLFSMIAVEAVNRIS